jgi:2-polyprenyl-3-methyl-5-hydroxy-6-metoxy-1,4-benzoquinol methylase
VTKFDPKTCDLCGDKEAQTLALASPSSMRSDHVIERRPLVKRICARCGLAREGAAPVDLDAMYSEEYKVAPADYIFYSSTGPQRRSDVFARWLVDAFGREKWASSRRVLEVGAGEGAVMAALGREFPHCSLEGLELCESSAQAARSAGLPVHSVTVENWDADPYDAIYSIAVLEHVPSPTAFLQRLRTLLKPEGLLYLAQPTQDVPSYDILFNDHLHHFGSEHLRSYAHKTGFRQVGCVIGHDLMPNFSLHCWQVTNADRRQAWQSPKGDSKVAETFAALASSFARFDDTLAAWSRQGRSIGVFGLNEVFALARTYTQLESTPLRCGLADDYDNPRYRDFGFPVVLPENAPVQGIDAVVLAANRVWLPQVEARLRPLGLDSFPVLC